MRAALCIATLCFAGCAAPVQWGKPGGTQSDFYQDKYACEQQAAQSYPPALVQRMTSPGVNVQNNQQTQTDCRTVYGQVTCTSRPIGFNAGIYNTPPSYITEDANAGARDNAMVSCFMAKGYRPNR